MQHKTLSEIIKQKRESLGLSCQEAAQFLKIPSRYLHYLEKNELQKMPALIYANGFLGKYSKMLGLDSKRILSLYEYEVSNFKEEKTDVKVSMPASSGRSVSAKTIVVTVVGAAILIIGAFWWNQVSLFFVKPPLRVVSPEKDITVSQNHIEIEGKTGSDNEVTINNQKVAVSEQGIFSERVSLKAGLNVFTIVTEDSYGKETVAVRKVVLSENNDKVLKDEKGLADTTQSRLTAQANNSMMNDLVSDSNLGASFKVKSQTSASWVKIEAGDKNIFSGILLPGVVRSFDFDNKEKIRIVANSASGVILVSIGDEDFKAIGTKGKVFIEAIINKDGINII